MVGNDCLSQGGGESGIYDSVYQEAYLQYWGELIENPPSEEQLESRQMAYQGSHSATGGGSWR